MAENAIATDRPLFRSIGKGPSRHEDLPGQQAATFTTVSFYEVLTADEGLPLDPARAWWMRAGPGGNPQGPTRPCYAYFSWTLNRSVTDASNRKEPSMVESSIRCTAG